MPTEKFYGCGACVVNCPEEALKLKIVRPVEYILQGEAQFVDVEVLEVKDIPLMNKRTGHTLSAAGIMSDKQFGKFQGDRQVSEA